MIGELGKTGTKGLRDLGTWKGTTYGNLEHLFWMRGIDKEKTENRDQGTGIRKTGYELPQRRGPVAGDPGREQGTREHRLGGGRVARLVWGFGWVPVERPSRM
jgi:hypothetical protein